MNSILPGICLACFSFCSLCPQMVGSAEEASVFGVTVLVFRPEDGPEGGYSQRWRRI